MLGKRRRSRGAEGAGSPKVAASGGREQRTALGAGGVLGKRRRGILPDGESQAKRRGRSRFMSPGPEELASQIKDAAAAAEADVHDVLVAGYSSVARMMKENSQRKELGSSTSTSVLQTWQVMRMRAHGRIGDPGTEVRRQENDGDTLLAALDRALARHDSMSPKVSWCRRSRVQTLLHDVYTSTFAKRMFGEGFAAAKRRLREERGWKDLRQECMVTLPRRWGKTTSVAMWSAAVLLTQPGVKVCIFSPGKRQSEMMLAQIRKMCVMVHGVNEKAFVKSNGENLWFDADHGSDTGGPHDVRQINSYPSREEVGIL